MTDDPVFIYLLTGAERRPIIAGMPNLPPNPKTASPEQRKRLDQAATDWLLKNDKQAKAQRFFKAKRNEKAAKQAKANPGLVAARRKALGL